MTTQSWAFSTGPELLTETPPGQLTVSRELPLVRRPISVILALMLLAGLGLVVLRKSKVLWTGCWPEARCRTS